MGSTGTKQYLCQCFTAVVESIYLISFSSASFHFQFLSVNFNVLVSYRDSNQGSCTCAMPQQMAFHSLSQLVFRPLISKVFVFIAIVVTRRHSLPARQEKEEEKLNYHIQLELNKA